MPYQLMVRSNRYIPIDIWRHSRFIINSNLKNGTSNLDEIDLFTTQFEDGTDLKLSLIKEDLLSPKLFDKEIAIRYKHGGYNTIKDSIIYRDIKAYLDKNNLEKTMRILSEDSVFISRLVDEYMPKDDNEQNKRPYINYNVLSKFNVVSSQYDINYLRDYIEKNIKIQCAVFL